MTSKIIPDNIVIFRGIEDGVLILLDTDFKDYERVIKKAIQRIKDNRKFFQDANIFIDGIKRALDVDEIGMARKLIKDKLKIKVTPYRESKLEEKKEEGGYPLVVEKTLRAGQDIQSSTDVIVFGDINPGARIISSGSIFVYGKLRGEAYAGQPGNNRSIITANGFFPLALSIGSIVLDIETLDETCKSNFCYAKVVGEEIRICAVSKNIDE